MIIPRHVLPFFNECLALFPCVAVIGVRQCGKTTLLNMLGKEWRRYDLEKGNDFELISQDPDLFFRLNPKFVAIDECQILPEIFPALRVAIDSQRDIPCRFVITGSSSPNLLRSVSETLAGRVAIIELGPFTLKEAYQEKVSGFYELLTNRAPLPDYLALNNSAQEAGQVADYWFHGGYPDPWLKRQNQRFFKIWFENYVQTYLFRDIQRLFPRLNTIKFRQFLQMLAFLSGTIINYSNVASALGVSQPTVREYFQIAHGSFIWRHVPAYEKNGVKRIVKHPKGYIRDTGLLHFLLKLPGLDDLLSHPQQGHSWEAMVIENIIRNLNWKGASFNYYYYRTSGGAEVDLVLEGDFGLIPIEIKHTQKLNFRELRGIKNFIKEQGCPYGFVVNNGQQIEFIDNNLLSIPFGFL